MNFDDIKYEISDFAHEKPFLMTFICIVVFLFIAAIVILMIQTTPPKKEPLKQAEPFTADAPVMIPDAPDIEKDYYPNRITENQWSKKDMEKWFTFPEDENMEGLEKANDKIVSDITGAAP
ncbi:MAG: hypothetical protein K5873_07730 [Treponema sp.]|nr:hypothetical protein [Treponema sp.]